VEILNVPKLQCFSVVKKGENYLRNPGDFSKKSSQFCQHSRRVQQEISEISKEKNKVIIFAVFIYETISKPEVNIVTKNS
jgi:hypothetical protein